VGHENSSASSCPSPVLAVLPIGAKRAARLGHADPPVTLRVYSHVLREYAQGVGDVFAQAINAG
jgi:hypothetical protein